MKTVLIDLPLGRECLDRLRAMDGVRVRMVGDLQGGSVPAKELVEEANVLLCDALPPTFPAMTSLELIQLGSSGYSQLFDRGLAERRIRACNARGVFDVPIAEWNIAMMVNLTRNLRELVRNQDAAVWDRDARFQRELRGAVVGIWGYGGIGRETARLAKALGLTVHVCVRASVRPRENVYVVPGTGDVPGTLPDRVFVAGQELEFLAGLDFLILAMPLSPSTDGIVGEAELQALPRRAFVLNPARGPLIQEAALLKALREAWIAGAALDTHYQYPLPPEHPLWRMPNVILTPHISGSNQNQHYLTRIGELLIENVRRYMSGQPLLNELSPDQLRGL
ncbi:MAG: D-2-hydroxyacid dehydrogenase [Phycisphaerae bacterium]|nr:D-2-hydroxyacid dehydrogenase [Phycisphaerae bacterium]